MFLVFFISYGPKIRKSFLQLRHNHWKWAQWRKYISAFILEYHNSKSMWRLGLIAESVLQNMRSGVEQKINRLRDYLPQRFVAANVRHANKNMNGCFACNVRPFSSARASFASVCASSRLQSKLLLANDAGNYAANSLHKHNQILHTLNTLAQKNWN